MAQLNIHIQPAFAEDLEEFMRLRAIKTKSEAVRVAVREGIKRITRAGRSHPDFRKWSGRALRTAVNPNPRFKSDDDLWT